VHSNVQIKASVELGGRSTSQHSQLGLSSSTALSYEVMRDNLHIHTLIPPRMTRASALGHSGM
jgi:hypothetical protein